MHTRPTVVSACNTQGSVNNFNRFLQSAEFISGAHSSEYVLHTSWKYLGTGARKRSYTLEMRKRDIAATRRTKEERSRSHTSHPCLEFSHQCSADRTGAENCTDHFLEKLARNV